MTQSTEAEPGLALLPATPNHTPVFDWLCLVRTYTLIAFLKAAENVHRANMPKNTIAADVILHPSWKGRMGWKG
jgi:hypothetical protein